MLTLSLQKSKLYLYAMVLGGLGIGLLVILVLSLSQGAFHIPAQTVAQIFLAKLGMGEADYTVQQYNVLWQIRLPRILLAMMVGGALGIAGAALQGLFRNPLVEPGIIGVSSGAALFAVVFIVFGSYLTFISELFGAFTLPIMAFIGGLLSVFLVYQLASGNGKTDISLLILAGVAINALAAAFIGLVIFYGDDTAIRNYTFWSLGDVGGASWDKVGIAFLLVVLPAGIILSQFAGLNALAMGEAEAFHIGINVQKVKYIVLFFSALMVGAGVSMTGIIGFVGLIVPHLIRLVFGADHRLVLPASFLLGALLLAVADLLARTIVSPAEMPIGILTAIIGCPFFIWLIRNIRKTTY
ncbi:MAG TPA: iron ABC transporter permease [Cyclobacteriaceae bacterium]|nr:iron ABC transporter permease [Cyclobacteriaceae bacterium]